MTRVACASPESQACSWTASVVGGCVGRLDRSQHGDLGAVAVRLAVGGEGCLVHRDAPCEGAVADAVPRARRGRVLDAERVVVRGEQRHAVFVPERAIGEGQCAAVRAAATPDVPVAVGGAVHDRRGAALLGAVAAGRIRARGRGGGGVVGGPAAQGCERENEKAGSKVHEHLPDWCLDVGELVSTMVDGSFRTAHRIKIFSTLSIKEAVLSPISPFLRPFVRLEYTMARHSKWHKVRQFKGAIDAKRSASYTKLAREITVAARDKGADPDMNAALRAAIDRARKASLPRENIERAVQKGAGGGAGEAQIETLTYEAYAPGGTALIIECLTDSRNRTANDVKHLLSKNSGTFAMAGAVTYLFDRVGVVRFPGKIPSDKKDEQELALIEVGASDVIELEDAIEIRSAPNDLAHIAQMAIKLGYSPDTVEMEWIPKALVETDEATGTAVATLIELLEEHDDVSRVYSNLA